MKRKQSGFTAVEGMLVFVIVGILGGTGYYVWHAKNNANSIYSNTALSTPVKGGATNSFEDCKKAKGSKILQTFQEICVTKDGKRFTENTSLTAKETLVNSVDNKVQFTLPAGWKVVSRSDNDPTCGGILSSQTDCITEVAYKSVSYGAYHTMIFKTSSNLTSWYNSTLGECTFRKEGTFSNGYPEMICHYPNGTTYTISDGKYIVYFVGGGDSENTAANFSSIVNSLKFL